MAAGATGAQSQRFASKRDCKVGIECPSVGVLTWPGLNAQAQMPEPFFTSYLRSFCNASGESLQYKTYHSAS